MSFKRPPSVAKSGFQRVYAGWQVPSRRNFTLSCSRAQEDHSNLAKRNSENSDSDSPVRLHSSRQQAYWAYSHDAKSNESQPWGLNALPPNPNNSRGGFARKREAQALHEFRKENPETQQQSSPFTKRFHDSSGISQEAFNTTGATEPVQNEWVPAGEGRSKNAMRRRAARLRDRKAESSSDTTATSTTQLVANQVGTFLDGKPVYFSPILLRDLCACPSCLDPSTKQKLFCTADIPATIKTSAVAQDAESLSLVWENDVPGVEEGHTTVLDIETVRRLRDSDGAPSANSHHQPGRQLIWDAGQYRQLDDFDYEDYMQDEATLYNALQQLHTYGTLFLRNVPGDEKSVSTIAERIGPVKNTFYGYTWDVRSVPQAKNVAYTSQDLGFHMDLLYMAQPPHLQFLHCIRSSAAGGASLFADSYKAAADLFSTDIEAFLDLAILPTTFHYNHPSSHLYQQTHHAIAMRNLDPRFRDFFDLAWSYRSTNVKRTVAKEVAEIFQRREHRIEDYIENVAWSPPFQAPFQYEFKNVGTDSKTRLETANEKMSRWHAAAQKFNKLIHRESDMYERMMRPGECVIFDNRRVLHARRAFDVGDAGKERWLRGAYLDWDPYWSKMMVLGRKFGKRELGTDMGGLVEEGRR